MKKTLLLILTFMLTLSLSSCFIIREKIKAPPDDISVPASSKEAICIKDDIEYKYVFQDDGVYLFFIDDVRQDETAVDHELEQAYLHNQSVLNYLYDEYGSTNCVVSDYVANEEE